MKRIFRIVLNVVMVIAIIWAAMTVWVQWYNPEKQIKEAPEDAIKTALLMYKADPIYNLDEQVLEAFAKGLEKHGIGADIMTLPLAEKTNKSYDLYLFCANTYNWAPDWKTSKFLKEASFLNGKDVAAITLGAGSTARSKRLLDEKIRATGANLMDSETYWLMRPNDDCQLERKNTYVARECATFYGEQTALNILNKPEFSEN
jgi:hypothetical protein